MLFVFFSLLSCAISRSKSRRSIWGHLPPSCHLRWRVGLNSTFIHEFWQKTVLSSSFESNNFHFHIWRPLDTFHLRPPLHFFLWNGWATRQCSDTIRIIYLFLKADGRKFYFFIEVLAFVDCRCGLVHQDAQRLHSFLVVISSVNWPSDLTAFGCHFYFESVAINYSKVGFLSAFRWKIAHPLKKKTARCVKAFFFFFIFLWWWISKSFSFSFLFFFNRLENADLFQIWSFSAFSRSCLMMYSCSFPTVKTIASFSEKKNTKIDSEL